MKCTFTTIFLSFLSISILAQDNLCKSSYMPLEEGLSWELTNYDKKGKEESVSRQKVTTLEETADGYKASIHYTLIDKKGKEVNSGTFGMECDGNSIYLDMNQMLDANAMAGMENMEVEMSGDGLEIPNDPEPGTSLPEGSITMTASTGAFGNFSMTLKVRNRKVEGMETVETPAGTFDCVKISQDTEIKTIVTTTSSSVNWYAKEVGLVKTETYNNKGKLMGSTVLTKLGK